MTTMAKERYQSVLKDLGFRGNILKDMEILVTNDEELSDLESFIVIKDNRCKSSMSIYNGYRRMRVESSPVTEMEFVSGYKMCSNIKDKVLCLQNLMKCYIEERWVNKLDGKLHTGSITLLSFYEAFNKNTSLHIKKLIVDSESLLEAVEWGSNF